MPAPRVCLLLICFILGSNRLPALNAKTDSLRRMDVIQLLHVTDINGLPQNSIKGIYKDRLGYIWIGTEQGMVRYDGSNFMAFPNPEMQSDRISFMVPDVQNGSILAVNEYNEVLKISNGRCRYIGKKIRISDRYAFSDLFRHSNRAYGFFLDSFRRLSYLGLKVDEGNTYVFHADGSLQLVGKGVHTNIFTFNGELFRVGRNLLVEKPDLTGSAPAEGTEDVPVLIDCVYNEKYRLFTYRNVLYLLSRKQGSFRIQRLISGNEDLTELNWFYLDEESRYLYLGTKSNGLYVYKLSSGIHVPAYSKRKSYYAQVKLNGDSVLSFSHAHAQNPFAKLNFHKEINAFFILKDRWDEVYLPTYDKGIIAFNTQSGFDRSRILFQNLSVVYMAEDARHRIWIADRNQGLNIYLNRSVSEKILLRSHSRFKKVEGNVLFDSARNEYHVFNDNTLYRLNASLDVCDSFRFQSKVDVRYLYSRPDWGGILILSYGKGLFFLNRNKTLSELPVDEKEYLKYAHCVFQDRQNNVWFTTNKGLFSVPLRQMTAFVRGAGKTLSYYHVNHMMGLYTNEFNGGCYPCYLELQNGYYSLPGISGLTWIRPEDLISPPVRSGILIDKITLGNTRLGLDKDIHVQEGFRNLRFEFSTVYWGNNTNLDFEYKIEDLDQAWIPMKNPYFIQVSSLPYGHYRIRLRVADKMHPERCYTETIQVHVLPLFYHTWWFYLLELLLLLGLVFAFIRLRNARIRRRDKKLQQLVNERTRVLSRQNKIISDNLKLLKKKQQVLNQSLLVKNRTMSVFSHNIVGPLKFISLVLDKTVSGEKAGKQNLESVRQTAHSLLQHSVELLEWAKMQDEQMRVRDEEVDVVKLIGKKLELFRFLLQSSGIRVHTEMPASLKMKMDGMVLKMILYNLLDNSVKYAPRTDIRIRISMNEGIMELDYADSGPGMKKELIDHYNRLMFDAIRPSDTTESSIGWFIIAESVSLLNGEFHIHDTGGNGFKASFRFWGRESEQVNNR